MKRRTLIPVVVATSAMATGIVIPSAIADDQATSEVPQTITSQGKAYNLVWNDELNGSQLDAGWWDINKSKP